MNGTSRQEKKESQNINKIYKEMKRMNETQVIKKLDQQSCEISMNAKGEYSFKIKVYGEDIDKAIETVFKKAEELKKKCQE